MRRSFVFIVLGALCLIAFTVFFFSDPPAKVPAEAPADVFSAGRAMEDVRGLTSTGKPHPAGTYDGTPRTEEQIADHTRAREFVERRLRELGLSPTIQKGKGCRTRGSFTLCAEVENVVARLEGTEPGKALMLAAHYDSTPFGPGAADDGAGVATILETVRAILLGPAPRRTLIVLIDDGEEMGLIGAQVFCNEHPWAKDVGVVLNFEARGTRGQVAMFETSDNNAGLIDIFSGAVKTPVASSVIYSLYKRLPNDTDMSIFKQAGMAGLNFAFADRVYHYHTTGDTAEELDPRSLQHMGDQSLAITRVLLTREELPKAEGDSVYFDLFTWTLIQYPASLGFPLALLSLGLTAAALVFSIRRQKTTAKRVGFGFLVWLVALVISTAVGVGLFVLLKAIRFPNVGTGFMAMRALAGDRHTLFPWLVLVCSAAALTIFLGLFLCPKVISKGANVADTDGNKSNALAEVPSPERDWMSLALGSLVLWTLFSVLLGRVAPAAAYLFTLVALCSGAALLYAALREASPKGTFNTSLIVMVPAAILWFPIVRVLFIMVGATMPPGATLPIFLMCTLFTPLLAAFPVSRASDKLPEVGKAMVLTFGVVFACAFVVACFVK